MAGLRAFTVFLALWAFSPALAQTPQSPAAIPSQFWRRMSGPTLLVHNKNSIGESTTCLESCNNVTGLCVSS